MSIVEPRTSVVEIFQGDYIDQIRHLEQQHKAAVEAERNAPRLLSDTSESARIAAEHAALVDEAKERALNVRVTALGRRAWRALVAEHPPRPGNDADDLVGVNEDTFKDALVVASLVDSELTESDLDNIADVDFERIYMTAFALNRSPASPKVLASPTSQKNDAT